MLKQHAVCEQRWMRERTDTNLQRKVKDIIVQQGKRRCIAAAVACPPVLFALLLVTGFFVAGVALHALPLSPNQPASEKDREPPALQEALAAARRLHLSPGKNPELVDIQVALWEDLVRAFPQSLEAKEQLAVACDVKYQQTNDRTWAERALRLWQEVLAARLQEGGRLPTDRMRRMLVTMGDARKLEETLRPLLTRPFLPVIAT